jgi:FkbM family methyltransferase
MKNINNIYLYWVGNENNLIKILRKLIYLHSTSGNGYNVHLINHENVNNYVSYIPDFFYDLAPAFQADYVRVFVICDYGGIWLDSDTLVMESLDSLFTILNNTNDGFLVQEDDNINNTNNICNGLFGSKPNTKLMLEWKSKILEILDIKKQNISWTELGAKIVNNMYSQKPELFENYIILNGKDNIYPINWSECVEYFINNSYDNHSSIVRNYQPLIILVNEVYKALSHLSEYDILHLDRSLNYFINKSFDNKNVNKNLLHVLYNDKFIYGYGLSDYISTTIIFYRCWKPSVTNIFNTILMRNKNKDNVVFDVGCNIGYYTILSSNHSSNIYSFDANKENIHKLNVSCLINNITNVNSYHNCISDKNTFYKMSNKDVVDRNGNIGALRFEETNDSVNNDALSIKLDDFIEENNIQNIDLLKIDIEGGELNCLKGTQQSLKKNIIKNIIITISPHINSDCFDILKLLKENDYNLYIIPSKEKINYFNDTNYFDEVTLNENNIRNKELQSFVSSINIQTSILAIKI